MPPFVNLKDVSIHSEIGQETVLETQGGASNDFQVVTQQHQPAEVPFGALQVPQHVSLLLTARSQVPGSETVNSMKK